MGTTNEPLSARLPPVVPAFRNHNIVHVGVDVDHPGVRSPRTAQVNRSCAGDLAVHENEASVFVGAGSLLGSQRALDSGYGVQLASLHGTSGTWVRLTSWLCLQPLRRLVRGRGNDGVQGSTHNKQGSSVPADEVD